MMLVRNTVEDVKSSYIIMVRFVLAAVWH